jgi:hypothetical protein
MREGEKGAKWGAVLEGFPSRPLVVWFAGYVVAAANWLLPAECRRGPISLTITRWDFFGI